MSSVTVETTGPPPTRRRLPSAERRELIVRAAVGAFAETGYEGTSTDDVARRAGVSQPYVVRLFGTKRDLFVEVLRHSHERIVEAFTRAAEEQPEGPLLPALGTAYIRLIADRDLLGMELQGYAASSDPVIRAESKLQYGRLVELVRDLTGASDDELQRFFALGMLLNIIVALDLHETPDVPWIATLLGEKCREMLVTMHGPSPE
jgi:AcrR family transcriptional regulator